MCGSDAVFDRGGTGNRVWVYDNGFQNSELSVESVEQSIEATP